MTHELKILPEYFLQVLYGHKTFELRKDDRGFKEGDKLILREWWNGEYTGRQTYRWVNYIFRGTGKYGLQKGYVILNLSTRRPDWVKEDEDGETRS